MIQTRHHTGECCCDHEHFNPATLREQFDDLTKPLIRHLLGHARSILQSEDLAWDAVQEALLSLWTKAQDGGQVLDYAGPWLCRAVVLRSLQICRQNGRRTRHERRAAAFRPESEECHILHGALEASELQQLLEMAMAALPNEFRIVLQMRTQDGLDYVETAERLGVPIGTVRSRLNRARTLLQKVLRSAICDHAEDSAQSGGHEGTCSARNESFVIARPSARGRNSHRTRDPDRN